MARRTPFVLNRSVFVSKRTLLVHMTPDARRISASGPSGLLEFKTAVRIMAIAALHRSFQNLVMEGRRELRLDLAVTTQAELRLAHLQHSDGRDAGLLGVRFGRINVGTRQIPPLDSGVWRVTIGASNVVAPVLAASEVVPLFFTGMAGKTRLSSFFRRFVCEPNDLCRVAAAIHVSLARAVARFAARHFSLPTAQVG